MDNLTVEQRIRTMRAVRDRDTSPEMKVRRLVFSLGYRYRLHSRKLPGCPDLIFPSKKRVIFVHGCFWHGHKCASGKKKPKSNVEYWRRKLERNRLRDIANGTRLRDLGWRSLILWECQLHAIDSIQKRVAAFLED